MSCAVEAVPRTREDGDELPAGAHWDDECPNKGLPDDAHYHDDCPHADWPEWLTVASFAETVAELHRQAHGDGPVVLCGAQPCVRLDLELLRPPE